MSHGSQEPTSQPTFEQALAELESVIHDLEGGQTGLAESLARYERWVALLKQCYGLLERAERKIELLCGVDAEGNPIAEPFSEAADATLEEKSSRRGQRRSAKSRPKAEESPAPDDIDEPQSLF